MTRPAMPPRRELPSDVRDRLRRRLWSELDRPTRSRASRFRLPVFAIVGAAALIVAASVVFTQLPTGAPEQLRASMGIAPTAATGDTQLDRCYAAATTSHRLPIRPQWKEVARSEADGVTVTAVRAAGKPLFCEITTTTVTVSNPDAVPAYAGTSATGALFVTTNGTVAGVTDPTWDGFELRATTPPDRSVTAEPVVSDGLFLARLGKAIGSTVTVEAVRGTAHAFGPIPDALAVQYLGN